MRNEASIDIDGSINDVFDITTNDVEKWSLVVIEEEVIEHVPGEVGSRFRTVTASSGKQMEFESVVTAYDRPHLSAIQMIGRSFDIQAAFRFESIDGGTRVTHISEVTGKGFMKFLLKLLSGVMHKASCQALNDELKSLKSYCDYKLTAKARLDGLSDNDT